LYRLAAALYRSNIVFDDEPSPTFNDVDELFARLLFDVNTGGGDIGTYMITT